MERHKHKAKARQGVRKVRGHLIGTPTDDTNNDYQPPQLTRVPPVDASSTRQLGPGTTTETSFCVVLTVRGVWP